MFCRFLPSFRIRLGRWIGVGFRVRKHRGSTNNSGSAELLASHFYIVGCFCFLILFTEPLLMIGSGVILSNIINEDYHNPWAGRPNPATSRRIKGGFEHCSINGNRMEYNREINRCSWGFNVDINHTMSVFFGFVEVPTVDCSPLYAHLKSEINHLLTGSENRLALSYRGWIMIFSIKIAISGVIWRPIFGAIQLVN